MSYMESQMQARYEAWMEAEREWYDMCNELVGREGWALVTLKQQVTGEMIRWLNEKCYGEYESHDREVVFQDPKKANWFALKWM